MRPEERLAVRVGVRLHSTRRPATRRRRVRVGDAPLRDAEAAAHARAQGLTCAAAGGVFHICHSAYSVNPIATMSSSSLRERAGRPANALLSGKPAPAAPAACYD